MSIQVRDLKVGDKVAINSSSVFAQRGYVVTKADKMKVVLTRGDNYERVYSVKRNCELATATRKYVDRYTYIITEDQAEAQAQAHLKRQNIDAAYRKVEGAANSKNIEALRTAMAELETLLETK
jgi:cation transport regulator ChaC